MQVRETNIQLIRSPLPTALLRKNITTLQELFNSLSEEPRQLALKDMYRILNQLHLHAVVAVNTSHTIVGIGLIHFTEIFMKDSGYIDDVVCADEYQGMGIGERIARELESIAREHNKTCIDLTSGSGKKRSAARKMWKKLGYKKRSSYPYRKILYDTNGSEKN